MTHPDLIEKIARKLRHVCDYLGLEGTSDDDIQELAQAAYDQMAEGHVMVPREYLKSWSAYLRNVGRCNADTYAVHIDELLTPPNEKRDEHAVD